MPAIASSLNKPTDYKYVINLKSSRTTFKEKRTFSKQWSTKYNIYLSQWRDKDVLYYRLRVGYFKNYQAAQNQLKLFKKIYPKAWIDKVGKNDIKLIPAWLKRLNSQSLSANKHKRKKILPVLTKEKLQDLFQKAEDAIKTEKYRAAVSLYTKILQQGESKYARQSLEYLGLAREKNGQLIHARAEYRRYLKRYPDGESAKRVRQRLIGIKTALLHPRKKLDKKPRKLTSWQHYGSVAQNYRKDVYNNNLNNLSNAIFSTDVNYLTRMRTATYDIKTQLTANHLYYLDDPDRKDRSRVNTMFINIADRQGNKSIKLGRQTQNKGGVLGRMDGFWLGYRLNKALKLNLVAGYPVYVSSSNIAQTNKEFFGVNFDIGTFLNTWDFNAYVIQQKSDTLTEREAVGGEVRYHDEKQNYFLLIDYDTYFSDLNTAFFVANWRFENNAIMVLNIADRNSPLLVTSNALQGQSTQSIEGLLLTYTEEELKQIARDRTARYRSATITATIPISNNWDFSADATVANLSSTTTSAGVQGIEGTGDEYYYSIQATGNSVLNKNELMRYEIRMDDTKNYKRTRYIASFRFPFKDKWRIKPRLTYELKKNKLVGETNKIIPEIKVDYKLSRNFKINLDVSYEKVETDLPVAITENNYHLYAGFIWDF